MEETVSQCQLEAKYSGITSLYISVHAAVSLLWVVYVGQVPKLGTWEVVLKQ